MIRYFIAYSIVNHAVIHITMDQPSPSGRYRQRKGFFERYLTAKVSKHNALNLTTGDRRGMAGSGQRTIGRKPEMTLWVGGVFTLLRGVSLTPMDMH